MFKNLKATFANLNACLLAAVSLLQAAPALAEYGPGVWVGCQTSSNGRDFRDAGYGTTEARARAVSGCTQNQFTNNGECRYNVSCEGDVPGYYAKCTTNSNGRYFYDGDADVNTARERAMNNCTQNQFTNNGECRYNISCQGGFAPLPPGPGPIPGPGPGPRPPVPPRPPIQDDNLSHVCRTSSNGRSFTVSGIGYRRTYHKAIATCRVSPSSDASECQLNAYCD